MLFLSRLSIFMFLSFIVLTIIKICNVDIVQKLNWWWITSLVWGQIILFIIGMYLYIWIGAIGLYLRERKYKKQRHNHG